MSQRFDRRKFLFGASGAALALPMLEAFAPRTAHGQTVTAPKRVLFVVHPDGRVIGDGMVTNGVRQDLWSPGATTMNLPTSGAPSPMLAALEAIRNEIVTIDGIDNLIRH